MGLNSSGPATLPRWRGRGEMCAVEVKSGELDMGVLGQAALFGAQLLARVVPHAQIHPLAAAPRGPSPLLRALLDEYRPGGLKWLASVSWGCPGRGQAEEQRRAESGSGFERGCSSGTPAAPAGS